MTTAYDLYDPEADALRGPVSLPAGTTVGDALRAIISAAGVGADDVAVIASAIALEPTP